MRSEPMESASQMASGPVVSPAWLVRRRPAGAGLGIESAKGFGAGVALVAAEADADDGGVMRAQFGGLAEDALGLFDGEVADGVEDPVEREAQLAGGALTGAFQGGEDGLEGARIEVAPHIDDADGDIDLGVDDALLGEVLHHAPRGQFVVFGVSEAARDGLEGLDEAGEISETVEGFGFSESQVGRVVARAELDQRGGQNGAFEVQMQLGLGQAADEGLNRGHSFSLAALAEFVDRRLRWSACCLILSRKTRKDGATIGTCHFVSICRGFVVNEGDGPGFAGLIVGDGAVALGCAVGLGFLADGHAGLELAHAGDRPGARRWRTILSLGQLS